MNNWFKIFGVPQQIISDRGSNFTSQLMAFVTKFLGIKQITTSAYNPQANGLVERFHRTFKEALKSINKPDAELAIALVVQIYNNTIREDLQTCPNILVFGKMSQMAVDFFEQIDHEPEFIHHQFANTFLEKSEQLIAVKTSNRSNNYPGIKIRDLKDSSHVWIFKPTLNNYVGPYYSFGEFFLIFIKTQIL
jgi:hypothetical protein